MPAKEAKTDARGHSIETRDQFSSEESNVIECLKYLLTKKKPIISEIPNTGSLDAKKRRWTTRKCH